MARESLKTCAVFSSSLFSFAWPEGSPDLASPWGKDCAAFIGDALRRCDTVVRADVPYEDEGGWSFEVTIAHERYELFIHWIPFGEPPVDYWAIQVRPLPRRIACFFSQPCHRTNELVLMIAHILENTEGITDMQWMTAEEFRRIY